MTGSIIPSILPPPYFNQVICIPFAWTHKAVTPITYDSQDWMGSLTPGWEWYYADYMLLLTFGGIPWQGWVH